MKTYFCQFDNAARFRFAVKEEPFPPLRGKREFAPAGQARGYEPYFYEPAAGGHGYGKDNKERASFTAPGHNFLRHAIGWELIED